MNLFEKIRVFLLVLFAFSFSAYASTPTYYVSASETASDTNDGSQAAPFATIQKAIDTAVNGGKIHVAEGAYFLNDTLRVTNAVEIVGAGRDATIINGAKIAKKDADNTGLRGLFVKHTGATVRDLTVMGCTNHQDGAGVWLEQGIMDNVRITKNQKVNKDPVVYVQPKAGGIYIAGGTLRNSLIDDNSTYTGWGESRGIGIYMAGGLVTNSVITANWVDRNQQEGIGVYMTSGKLIDCKVFENRATKVSHYTFQTRGCGLYMSGSSSFVDRCHIYSNGWNGVYMANGTLQNSLIYGHRTESGNYFAGLYQANGTVRNNTIYDNVSLQANDGRNGIHMVKGTAINNIIYGNGTSSFGSCCIEGGTFKTNIIDVLVSFAEDCIVADPKFIDAEGCNFRLKNDSSAIDVGTPVADYNYDIDGNVRPQGRGWDIGAYEAEPSKEKGVRISSGKTRLKAGDSITAEALVDNIDASKASYKWVLIGSDGAEKTFNKSGEDGLSFVYPNAAADKYSLSLVVTDADDNKDYNSALNIEYTVMLTTVYVDVNCASDKSKFPYATPETAAKSITEAMNSVWCEDGLTSTVYVAEGKYVAENSINIHTPVCIFGAGLGKTIINGALLTGAARLLYVDNDDSLVSDLTLEGCTNNVTQHGVGLRLTKGTVRNIEISKMHISSVAGSVAANACGVYISGGSISNIVVHDCGTSNDYGSASGLGIYMTGGIVEDAAIYNIILDRYEYDGVAVNISGGTLRRAEIYDSYGWDNSYQCYAGGIVISGKDTLVENIKIHGCRSAVHITGGTLRNALIYDNTWSQQWSSGVYQAGGDVYNCTVVNNSCGDEESSDYKIIGGRAINNITMRALNTQGTFATNLVAVAVTNGIGIIVADPGFKVTSGKNAYRLKSRSPAVNAGDNGVWSGVEKSVDLDGNPRIYRAESNGVVDLGCFESGPLSGFSIILR